MTHPIIQRIHPIEIISSDVNWGELSDLSEVAILTPTELTAYIGGIAIESNTTAGSSEGEA